MPGVEPDPAAETLVGGAPVSIGVLKAALSRAPRLAAADGGADTCLRHGLRPDRVVGDMDSISAEARSALAAVTTHMPDQDSTDLDKALRTSDAPLVLGCGFLGARMDHALAALSTLARRGRPPGPRVVLLSETDCLCLLPPRASLPLRAGMRVSLWPMGPTTGTSIGLRWPIDGLRLDPAGRIATSNVATGPVRILHSGGPLVLVLDADALDAMLALDPRA